MILPLAMPSYIAAMLYGYLLEEAGSVQTWWREMSGLTYGEYGFPAIRSTGGVIFILSCTLYPYIYLLARGAFVMLSHQTIESATMLGLTRRQLFTHLAIPLARPAIMAGSALVMMESLADFGVASLFGVPVLTTGMYRAWAHMYDPIAAARMASLLLIIIAAAIWLEKCNRQQAHYHNNTALYHPLTRWHTGTLTQLLMLAGCLVPVLCGFIIPCIRLLQWALSHMPQLWTDTTLQAVSYSFIIAGLTAITTLVVGSICAYLMRHSPSSLLRLSITLCTSGYALPGIVIAIGVMLIFIYLERYVPFLLTGTMAGVIWGCSLRFLTIAFQTMQAGLSRITPQLDEAATLLGASPRQTVWRVHLPMLTASTVSALLLVFIDTLKELPATLILRPFNVNTLAIRAYELAKDDMLPHAAPVALWLVALSILPVLYLNHRLSHARPGETIAC